MPSVQNILAHSIDFGIPSLDLELLIAYILKTERVRLYSHPETTLSQTKLNCLKRLVKKRQKGVPLAYLTNTKSFYNLEFYVDERVLIPRPETELIVEEVLALKPKSLLDVGVGSGTIAVTVAKNMGTCQVTAVDISKNALEVALHNAKTHEVKINFQHSDLLDALANKSEYDIIAANLPYIGFEENKFVSSETHDNEPHLALYSGKDGLDHYRRLLAQLEAKQIAYNYLIAEFGFGQEKAIMQMLDGYDYEIKSDLAGIPRIFILKN